MYNHGKQNQRDQSQRNQQTLEEILTKIDHAKAKIIDTLENPQNTQAHSGKPGDKRLSPFSAKPNTSSSIKESYNKWETTNFGNDKSNEKFRKLMGIKKSGSEVATEDWSNDSFSQVSNTSKWFSDQEQQYEKARAITHNQKGLGLGFSGSGANTTAPSSSTTSKNFLEDALNKHRNSTNCLKRTHKEIVIEGYGSNQNVPQKRTKVQNCSNQVDNNDLELFDVGDSVSLKIGANSSKIKKNSAIDNVSTILPAFPPSVPCPPPTGVNPPPPPPTRFNPPPTPPTRFNSPPPQLCPPPTRFTSPPPQPPPARFNPPTPQPPSARFNPPTPQPLTTRFNSPTSQPLTKRYNSPQSHSPSKRFDTPPPQPCSPPSRFNSPHPQPPSTRFDPSPPQPCPPPSRFNPPPPQPPTTRFNSPQPQPPTKRFNPPTPQPPTTRFNSPPPQPSSTRFNPPPQPPSTRFNPPLPQPCPPPSRFNPPPPQPCPPPTRFNPPPPLPGPPPTRFNPAIPPPNHERQDEIPSWASSVVRNCETVDNWSDQNVQVSSNMGNSDENYSSKIGQNSKIENRSINEDKIPLWASSVVRSNEIDDNLSYQNNQESSNMGESDNYSFNIGRNYEIEVNDDDVTSLISSDISDQDDFIDDIVAFETSLAKDFNEMTTEKFKEMKLWISEKVAQLLGKKNDLLVGFIIDNLEHDLEDSDPVPDPRKIQINLAGYFGGENARSFMAELWSHFGSVPKENQFSEAIGNLYSYKYNDIGENTGEKLFHVCQRRMQVKKAKKSDGPKLTYDCEICDIKCDTQAVLDIHLQGKQHQKKKLKFNEQSLPQEEKKLEPEKKKLEPILIPFRCDICNLNLTGKAPFDMHLQGIKHKKQLKLVSQIQTPSGSGITPAEKKQNLILESDERMTNKKSLEELSSLEASVRSVSSVENPKPDVLVPNKVAAGEASGTGKNAIAKLNEMFPGPKAPQYKITSQTGPPNNPTFFMVIYRFHLNSG